MQRKFRTQTHSLLPYLLYLLSRVTRSSLARSRGSKLHRVLSCRILCVEQNLLLLSDLVHEAESRNLVGRLLRFDLPQD